MSGRILLRQTSFKLGGTESPSETTIFPIANLAWAILYGKDKELESGTL